jgi:photosystem II stability/assembly factor-like uncharacterized protein
MAAYRRPTAAVGACFVIGLSFVFLPTSLRAGPDEWVATGPLGGTIYSLAVHSTNPDVVYAPTAGKLYVTSNGGRTWGLIPTCPAGVWQVCLDPSDDSTIYALETGSLYRSTDAGMTWMEIGQHVVSFSLDPNYPNRLFVGTMLGGVWKSTNRGDTWTDVSIGSESTVSTLAVSPGDSSTLYAGMQGDGDIPGGGVWKSMNGGITWVPAATGLPWTDVASVVVDPMHPDTIFAATQGGPMYGVYGLYRSTNGGGSWSAANTGLQCAVCPYDIVIEDLKAIPGANAAFCVVANGRAFRSDDGGDTWNPCAAAVNDYVLTVDFCPADPETRYFGAAHGVWKLTPTSIERRGIVPVGLSRIAVEPHGSGALYAVTNIAYISWDSGLTWDISTDGTHWSSATAIAVSPEYSNFVFVGGYNGCPGLFRSDDGGISWHTSLADVCVNDVEIDPVDWNIVYAGGLAAPFLGGLFKSTDNGSSWTNMDSSIVMSIAADPLSHNTVYVGTQHEGIKKSTDGGSSWVPINNGFPTDAVSNGFILSIAVNPLDSDILYCVLYCVGYGYTAFKSTNAGADWTAASDGLLPWVRKIVIDPVHPWVLYAQTDQGPYRSVNGARTWESMNNGLPSLGLNDLVIDPSNPSVLYCCSANGLFRYESTYDPTAVDKPAIPQPFELHIFPNPFSSAATVEYSVSTATHVRLTVYDVAGREVATLVDRRLDLGRYKTDLRATDLSAGVYFIKGEFGGRAIRRKCVVVK